LRCTAAGTLANGMQVKFRFRPGADSPGGSALVAMAYLNELVGAMSDTAP
jgi:hypothetical protein